MKLIVSITFLITFSTKICGQKFQQEQYTFPRQFQTPSSSFTSDSSIYLPPESQTSIPYFTMSNINKFPFQLLPPTGTKIPTIYPTPLPIYLSSTLRFEDEENENDYEISNNPKQPVSKHILQNHMNRSNNNITREALEKNESKFNLRMSNHQPPHTPQRPQTQSPKYVTITPNDEVKTKSHNPASRRMIMTSEIQRVDQGPDHVKASSYQNPQYIQAPGVFISSTTEPAIPILRLSNEMDLDGSFSYEALGADQTHYVQHSRMENMGTDKEEQVVEGSYSYIGDDGRTYTVHYIADSNGFRATGDHLPVPPPVPEIIQRSIQYNLAEEAKKPPHLRSSWENDDKEYDIIDRNIYNNPPTRNLFTGKTPEAFSFGFSQGSNLQNNLVSAASFQIPNKQNYEISMDQAKTKINPVPISPQITFLASQGAHNPSTPTQLSAKVANVEKSSLPQIMNYEAEIKDNNSDQEANKALWRWQYGLNSNTNQNSKNSISRSFSEGDDVIINFSDMTPDQYTNMIQTQISPQNVERSNDVEHNATGRYQLSHSSQNLDNKAFNEPKQFQVTTELYNIYSGQMGAMKNTQNQNIDFHEQIFEEEGKSVIKKDNYGIHPEIFSRHNFIPQSKIATQSYTFEDTSFEPSEISISNASFNSDINLKAMNKTSDHDILATHYFERTTSEPLSNTLKTINKQNEENSSFRPIIYNREQKVKEETSTTEVSMDEMVRENIFLRNLFKPYDDPKNTNKSSIKSNKQMNTEQIANQEIKQDKEYKFLQFQETPQNDIKIVKAKPLDVNNILNYVVLKNHFESIKTKQKNKPMQHFNQNMNTKDNTNYIPIRENNNHDIEPNGVDTQKHDYELRTLNRQQQQELQGFIKNYKVLQRQKNAMQQTQLLPEPQKHIKTFHTQSLPPLGRAGPSMKSYLPPTYL